MDATYYFNVLLINIPVEDLEYEDYWNLERVWDAQPIAYHFYRVETEEELIMEIEPEVVIEVCGQEVNWFYMYDDEEIL